MKNWKCLSQKGTERIILEKGTPLKCIIFHLRGLYRYMLHTIYHTFQWGVRKEKKCFSFLKSIKKSYSEYSTRKKEEEKLKHFDVKFPQCALRILKSFPNRDSREIFLFFISASKNYFFFISLPSQKFLFFLLPVHPSFIFSLFRLFAAADAPTPLTSHTQQNINSSLTTVRIEDDDRVW